MAARTLQPSEYEIQREVEALRDIRRRSTAPGALTIDPDLPNQSPTTSPTSRAWPSGPATSPRRSMSNSSSSSYDRNSSDRSSQGNPSVESDGGDAPSTSVTDDPFHLFWVPASVHPEIAPAEFRAFLKEHARAIPPDGAELGRSVSSSSTSSLGRKRSMLRRQYQPRENDGVEEEEVVPLSRNRSYLYNPVPLTFNDLQRLEQLAEEASESDDSSKLRTMLRRSLSLNLSPSAIDRMDNVPDMGDEADAPIIVPPPGQILRRAARTKIRKPGLPEDGGGHRFGSTRRGVRAVTLPPTADQRNSSDFSSSDHGDTSVEVELPSQRRQTFSDDGFPSQRPESFSEEAFSIFDAYVRDEEEDQLMNPPLVITSPPPSSSDTTDLPPSQEIPQLPLPDAQPALLDALGPILHEPQPQRLLSPQPSLEYSDPSRTPSPSAEGSSQASQHEAQVPSTHPTPTQQQNILAIQQQQLPAQSQYPPHLYQPPPPVPPSSRKEKDKKGLFGKWGSDKSNKKTKERDSRERPEKPEKEKDTGFFGSLFGGSKKKQDPDATPSMVGGNAGREAAQALLGASKSSKNYVPPSSPGLAPGVNPYARYPIHVERAIYRLSHIKLANPRRPLYEQVLISNLMFWYLGVINKAQNPTSVAQAQPNGAAGSDGERLEKERSEREREMEVKKKESGKRGSLTKTPAGGAGGRRAEMPVKGPQYEMQHRVMEQEYGNYNMQSNQQMGRMPANGQAHPRQQQQMYPSSPPRSGSPQPMHHPEQQYYDGQQQAQRLPPGAMAPIDQTTSWMSQNDVQPPRNPPPQRSRTPPQNHMSPVPVQRQTPPLPQDGYVGVGVGGGRPTRSLSANAVPVPQANGAKMRKGASVHAISPSSQSQARRPRSSEGRPGVDSDGMGEEEDMPLAALRQQQRRVM
ncbi:Protein zds1 [Leucoagaricus sp. SymC.cos]|nr:Protein zds1 [Leucoagaricus sp. SymC.cos]